MAESIAMKALGNQLMALNIGHVYINPPENFKMSWPCFILYRSYNTDKNYMANNRPYIIKEVIRMIYRIRDDYPTTLMDNRRITIMDSIANVRYVERNIQDHFIDDSYEIRFLGGKTS